MLFGPAGETGELIRLAQITDTEEHLRHLAALRSILTRHEPFAGICPGCRLDSPCPDETDVINAVLGKENP